MFASFRRHDPVEGLGYAMMRYVILVFVVLCLRSPFYIFLDSRFSQRRRLGLGSFLVLVFSGGSSPVLGNAFGFGHS